VQIPLISGVAANERADWRDALPVNLVAVPKNTGVSGAYLRTAPGIVSFASGPGVYRGGINWRGVLYAVMGSKLVKVSETGTLVTLGDVGGPLDSWVTMDYGFDRLAVWSGGRLYYYTDTGAFLQVTDSDLGVVPTGCWIAGYFASTDGANIVVTELNDPTAVDPLKYGSAEADSDAIVALKRYQGQLLAFGRNTVEVFVNTGGSGFPFTVSQGSQVAIGAVGPQAAAEFGGSFGFVGSPRNAPPSVYLLGSGTAQRIATREIEQVLAGYTEEQLAAVVVEAQSDAAHQFLFVHLPDQSLVFDAAATAAMRQPVWHIRKSGASEGQYRMKGLIWCYGEWIGGDTSAAALGRFDETMFTHYGESPVWRCSTPVIYNGGKSALLHEMELMTLPGRIPAGPPATVWRSYSLDGETWSQETPASAGAIGERGKRIVWRRCGMVRNQRIERFRGDGQIAITALEVDAEPLARAG
jgi:hypothetical protein